MHSNIQSIQFNRQSIPPSFIHYCRVSRAHPCSPSFLSLSLPLEHVALSIVLLSSTRYIHLFPCFRLFVFFFPWNVPVSFSVSVNLSFFLSPFLSPSVQFSGFSVRAEAQCLLLFPFSPYFRIFDQFRRDVHFYSVKEPENYETFFENNFSLVNSCVQFTFLSIDGLFIFPAPPTQLCIYFLFLSLFLSALPLPTVPRQTINSYAGELCETKRFIENLTCRFLFSFSIH